jgi:predicted nucleic acid-binding protein
MVLVLNSSPLSCFARADRLLLLEQLTVGYDRVTVKAVLGELEDGSRTYPALRSVSRLPWLRVEPADDLSELRLFAEYSRRLVSGRHNVGEASVLAWAEAHGAIAVLDDQAGVQMGRERGVEVRRTLALIARGIRDGILSESGAAGLVDDLIRGGARFPTTAAGFIGWIRDHGLV